MVFDLAATFVVFVVFVLLKSLHEYILILMTQINDHYEFPLQLDLDRDDGKYLSPDADRRVRNLYTLHRSDERFDATSYQSYSEKITICFTDLVM